MAFIPVDNVLAVDVVYEWDAQVVENTLYFKGTSAWTEATATDWLGELRTLIEEDLLPVLASAIKLTKLIGTLLTAVDSFGVLVSVSPPATGGDTNPVLPNNISYAIQFKTASRGRSFAGRNYVPGLVEPAVTGNLVSDDFRTNVLAFYTELKALATANDCTWVVVSRYSGIDPVTKKPIPRVTGLATPITAVTTADKTIDSQRRRLPGRGR